MAYVSENLRMGTVAAAADLRSHQWKLVKMTAGGINICAAATDVPIGILANKPNIGEAALVDCLGTSKVEAGAAIAVGGTISTAADAQAVTSTTSGHIVVGQALEAATAAGQVVTVFLHGPRTVA